jgi:uncharacterized membrane protein YkoI
MKRPFLLIVTSVILSATAAISQAVEPTALDKCVKAALQAHPGKMKSLSSEIEDGKAQYELDIKSLDGKYWEIECDAETGKINRTEREIRMGSEEFKSKAKITREDATKAALAKYPGKLINTEYDIEDDGEISYEFIIQTKDGKYIEIEVDAVTGKLAGEEEVLYHIGS